MAGRPSNLSDPAFLKLTAECFAAGMTREKMCEELGVADPMTITRYRKDPRVKAVVQKLIEDRAIRISAKVDSKIEYKLQDRDGDLTVDELIKIRKEYGGASLARKEIDDSVVEGALRFVEGGGEVVSDPSVAEAPAEAEDA